MNYDDSMTERAVTNFGQRLARGGFNVDQPCSSRSFRQGDIVTLGSVNERMARYRVRRDKQGVERIRFID